MAKPNTLILRTAGTNCDIETQTAFELAGANAKRVHINRLISKEIELEQFQILVIPGGFSYGDDIASGKILANEIKYKLGNEFKKFAISGKPIIGVCNGFQVLVKMGILPDSEDMNQTCTLTFNDSDKFECRWVHLKSVTSPCLWTKHLPDIIQLPVAHGEGKFIAKDESTIQSIEKNKQVALRYYHYNPNGSQNNIAGICNRQGNVFGLMPHPERFIYSLQHPNRVASEWGLQIYKNAVKFCK